MPSCLSAPQCSGGILGALLSGVGQAVTDFWNAHKNDIAQAGLALITDGGSLEGEALTAETLRGKSVEEVDRVIPETWTREPTVKGGGTRYKHPTNKGEQIRVQPGKTRDPNPAKQGP